MNFYNGNVMGAKGLNNLKAIFASLIAEVIFNLLISE
jgi:hypothetical protein